jgi:hypothetical protein
MDKLVAVHPSTNAVDAACKAWRIGRQLKTIDGRVYMAPGRNRAQIEKALKAFRLREYARSLKTG